MLVDVFVSSTSPYGAGPYLLVRYGRDRDLPADPSSGRWRYFATMRADIDNDVHLASATREEVRGRGYLITWRSPL